MNNKTCVVQFIHPGKEHRPDDGLIKHWNTGSHSRKFIKQEGRYLEGGKLRSGEVVFWTEWEPESRVVRKFDDPIHGGPRFIYEPYYVRPRSYEGLQNTDPFVFGEQFHYTGCQ